MPEERLLLGLGSNLGARRAQLQAAIGAIAALPAVRALRCSSLYETQPWGLAEQQPFLNCALELYTRATPLEWLGWLQALERRAGRAPAQRWGPRSLDIDVLLFGARRVRGPELCVPHPHLHERNFVLVPLVELAPDARHPELNRSARELLEQSADRCAVRRVSGPLPTAARTWPALLARPASAGR